MATKNNNDNKRVCGYCKHSTPYMEFRTLSIEGKPTMGTCPFWTASKCMLLSLDTCEHFDMTDEYSGVTVNTVVDTNNKAEAAAKKEALEKMREDYFSAMGVVKETLPYGNVKKKGKKKK